MDNTGSLVIPVILWNRIDQECQSLPLTTRRRRDIARLRRAAKDKLLHSWSRQIPKIRNYRTHCTFIIRGEGEFRQKLKLLYIISFFLYLSYYRIRDLAVFGLTPTPLRKRGKTLAWWIKCSLLMFGESIFVSNIPWMPFLSGKARESWEQEWTSFLHLSRDPLFMPFLKLQFYERDMIAMN